MPAETPVDMPAPEATIPSPALLTIRVHDSLATVEDAWRRAERELAGYAFQTFDWMRSTQETLGAAMGLRPCIVTVSEPAGRVVMLLPLGIARRRGWRELTFLGSVVTDYNAPLIDAALAHGFAVDDAGCAALWRRLLEAVPTHDLVRVERMPATLDGVDGSLVPNPLVRLPGVASTGVAESARLPASHAVFLKSLKSRFVAATRRHYRRLAEMGPVSFQVVDQPADVAGLVATLIRLKSRRWVETKAQDWSHTPAFRRFYEVMSTRRPGDGQLHVSELKVGDTVVAAHWGVIWRRRFYYLLLGWEAGEWRLHSPGRLLIDHLIADAIARDVQVFDFTAGHESYKQNWVDTTLLLYGLTAATTPRGRVALAIETSAATLRTRAKEVQWLRRVVRRARGLPPLKEPAT